MSRTDATNDLIARYLDEVARADEIDRLQEELQSSEATADAFVEAAFFDGLLQTAHAEKSHEVEAVIASLAEEAEKERTEPCVRPIAAVGGTRRNRDRLFQPGGFPFAYLVSAVSLVVAILICSIIPMARDAKLADEPASRIADAGRTETHPVVGRITGLVDVVWSDDPRFMPPLGYALVSIGRRYEIASGLVEITYDSGAKVVLEGPCEYEVDSATGGYLPVGKLIARVEAKGGESGNRGVGESGSRENRSGDSTPPAPLFAIRTPSAVVTDLGTKFGVIVGDDGDTATHVIEGRVELRVLDDDRPENQAIRIAAGESVHVERPAKDAENNLAAVARGKANAGLFPVSPNKSKAAVKDPRFEKFRRWQAFGEQLLKRDDLVAYYDFQPDRKDLSILRNRVPSSKHGRIENARWAPGRFLGKYALHYNNSKSVVHVDLSGLEGSRQLTFAAWVRCDEWPEQLSCILAADAKPIMPRPGAVVWTINKRGGMSLFFDIDKQQKVEIAADVLHAKKGQWNRGVAKVARVEKGRWKMVAISCNLDTTEASVYYGDNRWKHVFLLSTPFSESLTFYGGPYSIGNWHRDMDMDDSLHGSIGALMVFRTALSPDEMDRLRRDSDPMDDDELPEPPDLTPW